MGAVQVRFSGLDFGEMPETPVFMKSLAIDHAMDGEVMVAYGMNGTQFPSLNGFPLRPIVPDWFSTYWAKMLRHIEVLDKPDDNYWMHAASLIPDTAGATMAPDAKGVKMVPMNRMVPLVYNQPTSQGDGAARCAYRGGMAFGGDTGVRNVAFSTFDWPQAVLHGVEATAMR